MERFIQQCVSIEPGSPEAAALTKSDLAIMHFTGRDRVEMEGKYSRTHNYRNGVQTRVGDLELSQWRQLAEEMLARNCDADVFGKCLAYARTCPWLHTEREIRDYALGRYLRGYGNEQS